MEVWFSRIASLLLVSLGLAACGGGGDGSSTGGTALVPRTVEAPAQLGQVDAYQPQPGPLALQGRIPLSRGPRPDASAVRLSRLEAAPGVAAPMPGRPLQIGSAREIPAASDVQRMQGLLQFKPGAAGEGPTAAVSFTSPGAAGLRLGLRVSALPAGARVRGYAQGGATAFDLPGSDILAAIRRNRDAGDVGDRGRTWWTPVVESEEVTLEIALPPGASPDTVKVAVPLLSHLTVKAQELATLLAAGSASCEIDVSCEPDADAESRATARMIFVDGGYSYACTGTLLNDSQSSGTPYFLTADHCISTQTAASSLTTYWSYRSASCNSGTLSPAMQQVGGGATLLYASTDTDTSFLRLAGQPPATASFAGWSTAPPQLGQAVTGVHHPHGDLQKISLGSLAGFINCDVPSADGFSCGSAPSASASYLNARWSQGTVEAGSSGSGLFAAIGGSRYLVGQLKGGSATCTNVYGLNAYGRFDVAYGAALSRWLSPAQSSSITISSPALPASVARVPVHRFYNYATGAHFYTALAAERDYVLATFPTYAYEGVAFYAYATPVSGAYPVYRLYNAANHRHFYTMATDERDAVLARFPEVKDEGISWYAQWGSGGTATAMYRFYNFATGAHFYTLSEVEKAIVLKNYPTYTLEGIAYYAWTTQ